MNSSSVSTLDSKGRPWASLIYGEPGFIAALSDNSIRIRIQVMHWDPLEDNLIHQTREQVNGGLPFGMLGIELHTRRRNRVNGHVVSIKPDVTSGYYDLTVDVDQSYGNCPKYIQTRQWSKRQSNLEDSSQDRVNFLERPTETFPEDVRGIIKNADSFYIASRFIDSATPKNASGLDVSHRGGHRGFVRLLPDNKSFVWPDYKGNNMFMTLGNILKDSRAGVLFLNYDENSVVYITGVAKVIFNDEARRLIPGMTRVIMFAAEELIFARNTLPYQFQYQEDSPFNPPVRYTSEGNGDRGAIESINWATLVGVKRLSFDTSSFTFETSQPVTYLPGQYATFDFSNEPGVGQLKESILQHEGDLKQAILNDDLVRTWTISSTPPLRNFNIAEPVSQITITVKQKPGGLISTFLHQHYSNVTSRNMLRVPLVGVGGTFTVFQPIHTRSARPKLLFLAAGVGITPFLSMLPALRKYDVHLVVTARREDDLYLNIIQPFSEFVKITALLTREKPSTDSRGSLSIHSDRLNALNLAHYVEDVKNREVYICGPNAFMEVMMQACAQFGINADDIHSEEFSF
ncbi:hypothetical protein K7432_006143 [Basidiobolus ranarum]|uniref:FAD-binding FR-type domain-containing protein n=1 Tax=Basidiobolus ranarum TaxID=34480 RepID=A0ABR2WVL6_9FUNG